MMCVKSGGARRLGRLSLGQWGVVGREEEVRGVRGGGVVVGEMLGRERKSTANQAGAKLEGPFWDCPC